MNPAAISSIVAAASLAGAAALAIYSSASSPRSLMTTTDYEQSRRSIDAEAQVALDRCHGLDGRDRGVCRAQVEAGERIRKADLEADYLGTVNAAAEARLVRAKARYEVARASCTGSRGLDRIACLRNAEREKSKAADEARLAAAR